MGANSLGWCALELDENGAPTGVLASGSRIFSDGRDPKSGASLAMDRRAARAMRRNRDRFKQRQAALMKHLTEAGLFPAEEAARKALEGLDPYELRARGLYAPLTLHELGRALWHINQRRGFKSNRKTDKGADDESGKIRIGVARLHEAMRDAGAQTYGEFLHLRRQGATDAGAVPSVRTRLRPETGDGAKGDGYDFYPDRALLEEEFDALWDAQAAFHTERLTPKARDRLFEVVFHQRPLKKPQVGLCTLLPSGEGRRLPKAHPLFQQRRLYEELNALQIIRAGENPAPLSLEQRNALFAHLKNQRKATFAALRRTLKLERDARFNKESENRTELKGDEVAAEMGAKSRFGVRWALLDWPQQWAVIERVLDQESDADEAELVAWLQQNHGLDADQAVAAARANLPAGYGRFGQEATQRLVDALKEKVRVYSEAVQAAGLHHHSDFRTGEVFDQLPYYGEVLERHIMPGSGDPDEADEALRVGRVTNPTVHIGLNQLRRVLNRLICAYGRPAEIALELARDLKLDDERKKEMDRKNAQNRKAAEARSAKLIEIGRRDTGANRALLRLWEELNPANALDRRCVYSGEQISIHMLFSGAVEVDHILPFSATLDDSGANKIVCLREANRNKRKRSPFEAFGHTGKWDEIAERAARLPKEKRWRFEPDAMARFDKDGGFLARQLIDTQYLSRLAREYLSCLYAGKGEDSSHVWVSPGRLTEMVRRAWGLNELLPDHNYSDGQPKNRKDHRHHAIDAVVTACLDRGQLQRMARQSALNGLEGAGRAAADLPEPWKGFRNDVEAAVAAIVVSHRTDHGRTGKAGLRKGQDATAGRLHNDTAYGLTGEKDAKGADLVVHRRALGAFRRAEDLAEVRDPLLREALQKFTRGKEGKAFEAALRDFSTADHIFTQDNPYKGVRRVRVIKPLSVIPVRHGPGGVHVKGYKGDSNHRYDVWETPDGKWAAEVVSMFDAHQPDRISKTKAQHPTARKILRLHQDDVLAVDRGEGRELLRVVKFSEKQLALAPLNESGSLKARDADKDDPFKYVYPSPNTLKRWRARQVRIDELGRVQDPGPRTEPA